MLSLPAPLVLFKKSRLWASTRFHLLPSFHHHLTQHDYTTQTVTHTVILTSTSYSTLHRYLSHTSGAWIENRPHSMPSIRLARNPKHVIVQWVGIGTHTNAHWRQMRRTYCMFSLCNFFQFLMPVSINTYSFIEFENCLHGNQKKAFFLLSGHSYLLDHEDEKLLIYSGNIEKVLFSKDHSYDH